ncbi:DUF998 domain-containing protein [Kribbella sp. CA-294648]|uniref:DUF998 domain-containing protein n=1 Tax=Kribbella sp. CA-294648 TaxID=3239948 RepID=UPI003D8E16CC
MTATEPQTTVRNRLLYCGLLAGPLFALTFLIAGATRGDGYDPLRHPVSSLQLGDHGWIQTANFLVAGALTTAFAIGLWRETRLGAVLVGVWGVGLVGAGIFTTDPVSGYPVGTPAALDYTTSGALHDAFSLPAFLALAVVQVVLARGQGRGWAIYSLLSALVFLAAFVLASAGFSQTEPLVDLAGLYQRIAVIVGFAWLTALAWRKI